MKSILILVTGGSAFAKSRIAGYEPHTLVIDQNKIDMDQRDIEQQLALGSNEGYESAIKIYQRGAHCASYSRIKVQSLQSVLTEGDRLTGAGQDGSSVTATVVDNYPKGTQEIEVLYSLDETTNSFCHVGGSPKPLTDGCELCSAKACLNFFKFNVLTLVMLFHLPSIHKVLPILEYSDQVMVIQT